MRDNGASHVSLKLLVRTDGHHSPWIQIPRISTFCPVAKTSIRYAKHLHLIALGSAIRAVRCRAGLSQEGLAHAAELDRSYVGGIERGEVNLALINLTKIAAALNCSAEALMREAGL